MVSCVAITGDIFSLHDLERHDESSDRLRRAQTGIPSGTLIIEPVQASIQDIERVHRPEHVHWLKEMSKGTHFIDTNTYITRHSFDVALYAAGSAIRAVHLALEGTPCFAIVRPPGHHAEENRAMGFCLFNNVAVAAVNALDSVERVAIVDWDVHHGNGTQQIFYTSDRVLYCSIHQYNTFPFTGWVDEVGRGLGKGYNLNAPLLPNSDLYDYVHVFSEVFLPAIRHFRPDAILVSAGQDALTDDPHGMMRLIPQDYGTLAGMLAGAADCPLALVLEGGYGPSLGAAISSIFQGVNHPVSEIPTGEARKSTQELVSVLKKVRFI
jgi:acetoin utilization deacetylase AcuC-like enzyme